MNQSDLFPADPPALAFEYGGYVPPDVQIYRGCEFSTTYVVLHGMSKWRVPTLFWLMDLIIEALQAGPVHWYDLCRKFNVPVDTDTLSRHLDVMRSRGLVLAEPVYYGSSSPHLGNYHGFQYRYSLPEGVPS